MKSRRLQASTTCIFAKATQWDDGGDIFFSDCVYGSIRAKSTLDGPYCQACCMFSSLVVQIQVQFAPTAVQIQIQSAPRFTPI